MVRQVIRLLKHLTSKFQTSYEVSPFWGSSDPLKKGNFGTYGPEEKVVLSGWLWLKFNLLMGDIPGVEKVNLGLVGSGLGLGLGLGFTFSGVLMVCLASSLVGSLLATSFLEASAKRASYSCFDSTLYPSSFSMALTISSILPPVAIINSMYSTQNITTAIRISIAT